MRALALAVACGAALLAVPGATASPGSETASSAVPRDAVAPSGDGRWRVDGLGRGRFRVSWTSSARLPVTSDRPTIAGGGLAFGPAVTRADGRTVEAVVTAATAPDPADLDVVLSGDRLDEPGHDLTDAGEVTGRTPGGRAPAGETTPLDAPDPGLPGAYDVVRSDYELDPVKLPGFRRPIEMVGHVVEPDAAADTGPRPLVLFLHGRHSVCYDPADPDGFTDDWPCRAPTEEIPSQLGYDYVQQTLASQGYTTVSIRANGINAQDFRAADGGAEARAALVERHLQHWVGLAAEHRVDLSRVVLVGHSRGGEGVDRAALQIPLDAPYRIVGQVLVAPTDFASHTAPYVPTMTLLPYCDGDVSDLQGQRFTDTSRDLTRGADTSLKSSVLVMGANHNFFNTEWTPGIAAAPSSDDWFGEAGDAPCGVDTPTRLSGTEQQAVGNAYVAGAVHLFTGDDAYLPLLDGSPVSVPSAGGVQVLSHALGGGRSTRRPGVEATPTLATGGATTRLCRGGVDYGLAPGLCGGRLTPESTVAPHWYTPYDDAPTRKFLELGWTAAGAAGGLRFDEPLDLRADRLELRTIVDPRRGDVDVRVRIRDAAGGSAVLVPDGGTTLPALPGASGVVKWWAQPLLVDASGATGVDLADVVSVELLADSPRGRVWVTDVSSAPATTAEVPDVRMATVDVGEVTVPEGDGRRPAVVQVPFTVTGEVTSPARFLVTTAGQERGSRSRYVVDLAPGQTSGSIAVAYTPDRVYGGNRTTRISLWPLRGVVTDDYTGSLRVVEDEPRPRLSIRALRPTVAEGEPLVFRVAIDARTLDDVGVDLQVVAAGGTDLTVGDVPAAWREEHVYSGGRLGKPLHRAGVYVSGRIRAGGRTFVDLTIPTRRDGVREGREVVGVVVGNGRGSARAIGRVAPSR